MMNSNNSAVGLGMQRIIDAHCHVGQTPYVQQSVQSLLAEMDACGVEKAIICGMGSHIVCNNVEGNDFVSGIVKANPKRFVGFASINPWYGEGAIKELRRSVIKLNLRGLKLHPSLQGFQANDRVVFPIIEEAIRVELPIYIHSGTPVYSLPLQILALAQKYPEGKFILGHMGGADFYIDVPLSFPNTPNVYLETSLTCHTGYVAEAIRKVGSRRIVFGSDSPISQINVEIEKIRVLNLDEETLNRIMWHNIVEIVKM